VAFGRNADGGPAIQLVADGTDPNQALMLTNYASGIIASQMREMAGAEGVAASAQPIQSVVRMLYNPQGKSAYNFVPGVMGLILMLICAMMTAIAIVREKETGTMEVLLASPVRPIYIILSKAVPYFVLSMANLATILLLAVFVLGVPVSGGLGWLVVVSLIFVLAALALGLLISTLVGTQMAAMLASGMGLMMPTMLLSGLIFPIESMPGVLQGLSCVVPARWYIEAVRRVMIQGVEVRFVLREIAILSGMALVFIAVALRNFKTRLQ
jgi:ABC-2 type transport system permease protein